MPYQPTGKPPGRPKTTTTTAKPKAAPKAAPRTETPEHPGKVANLAPPEFGKETALHMADGRLCKLCWPDGWPDGACGLGCEHGGPYIRRLYAL